MGKGEEGEPAQKGPLTVQEEVGLVTQRSQLTPATLPAVSYPLCRCYRYIQRSDLVYLARYAAGRNRQVVKDILEPLRGAVWLCEMPSNAVSLRRKFLLPPEVNQLTSSIRAWKHAIIIIIHWYRSRWVRLEGVQLHRTTRKKRKLNTVGELRHPLPKASYRH